MLRVGARAQASGKFISELIYLYAYDYYVEILLHTYTDTHIFVYTQIHTNMYMYMCMSMYVYIYVQLYMHIYTRAFRIMNIMSKCILGV